MWLLRVIIVCLGFATSGAWAQVIIPWVSCSITTTEPPLATHAVVASTSAVLDGTSYATGTWLRFSGATSYPLTAGAQVRFIQASNVPTGSACPADTKAVLMPIHAYNFMIDSANVVNELKNGWNLITMLCVVASLLVGLVFGWKIAQRGSSQ